MFLQRYSQSRRLHGSWSFHWFAWYNSCGTEKCPLAVNGSRGQERPPDTVLYGGRLYDGFVNSTVSVWMCNQLRKHVVLNRNF